MACVGGYWPIGLKRFRDLRQKYFFSYFPQGFLWSEQLAPLHNRSLKSNYKKHHTIG